MITERLIFKIPSLTPAPFHPSDLLGGQLYLRKDQATAPSWVSDIGIARDFIQPTVTQQPVISPNSVDYDGINDTQGLTESHPFGLDALGSVFISGYFDNSMSNLMLSTSDISETNEFSYFGIESNGKARLIFNDTSSGGSSNILDGNIVIPNSSYYYIEFTGNGIGNAYTVKVNGILDTLSITSGSNDSKWFNSLLTTDRLSLAAILRPSSVYRLANLNKIYYNNTVISSADRSNLETFFSDPTNY